MILGVAGKMGPTLARLAKRAAPDERVIGVARFSDPAVREAARARTASRRSPATCSTAAPIAALPKLPNVVFAAGHKFGATGDPALTWAMNAHVPALVAERFRGVADRRLLDRQRLSASSGVGTAARREDDAARAGRRVRAVVPRPRAHVRVLLGQPRHAGPDLPPQLRDRHALRRAARHRVEGAARRAGRRDDGPRQRDLAGRRERAGAALPRRTARRRRRRSTSPARRRSRCARSRTKFGARLRHDADHRRQGGADRAALRHDARGGAVRLPAGAARPHARLGRRLGRARPAEPRQADQVRGPRWRF